LCDGVRVWNTISQELLRAIRGSRSQEAFSRKVGISVATVAAWENGRRFPTLPRTLAASEAVGVDAVAALMAFHAEPMDPGDTAAWLRSLQGDQRREDIATESGASVHQVGRWLSGRAEPRLPDLLTLVHAMTGRGEDLVAEWVGNDNVPSIQAAWRARDAARRVAWEHPWSEGILQVLAVHPGPMDADAIARALNADNTATERALEALRAARLVRRRSGRYRVTQTQTVDTSAQPERVNDVKRHWAGIAAQSIGSEDPLHLSAYNVFSCSEDDLVIVREELLDAFRRARARIASSTPTDRAGLLMVQLVPFADA
jgi:transcriptional regulator with XRE-family HTH domain